MALQLSDNNESRKRMAHFLGVKEECVRLRVHDTLAHAVGSHLNRVDVVAVLQQFLARVGHERQRQKYMLARQLNDLHEQLHFWCLSFPTLAFMLIDAHRNQVCVCRRVSCGVTISLFAECFTFDSGVSVWH